MHAFLAEQRNQGGRDTCRTARLRHHLAQHRAEGDDDRNESQHRADSILQCLHDPAETAFPPRAQRERNGDQGDEKG